MSVIMTLRVQGDPDKLQQQASGDAERLNRILDRAKEHGLIAHRWYASDGEFMVVDEWPDEQSFEAFFGEVESDVQQLMGEVGVTSEPERRYWRKLDVGDDVGWGA